jgi:pimeloyl-ACP methyl ester carboxylesterase
MVTRRRSSGGLAVVLLLGASLAAPAQAGHVPAHPVDASPCGRIVGQPGVELGYCLWPGPAPLLVLLSGLGNDAQSWPRAFVEALNGFAGVLVYDRRGYGGSAALAAQPVTARATAADLQALLRGLQVREPVVLVGHSLGGLYAQYYARSYPPEVAAVVLIDAASPFEPIGDPRFATRAALEPGSPAALENAGIDPAILETRALPPFPPIPLLVLSATDHASPPDFERLWQQIQAQVAAQSPFGRQVIFRGSGHYIQDEQPDLVADQIEQLWRQLEPQGR